MILVAGGSSDPNIATIIGELERSKMAYLACTTGMGCCPRMHWDLVGDQLFLDGQKIAPDGVFLRYDVFSQFADGRTEATARALAWYSVVAGWTLAHPTVRFLNQASGLTPANKPLMLVRAREAGLPIPPTTVSNDVELVAAAVNGIPAIAKCVNDGGYTEPFTEALTRSDIRSGRTAQPAIIQPRLVCPEIRIFRVGQQFHAFCMTSDALDYRLDPEVCIKPVTQVPENIITGLQILTDSVGLTFGAADFKTVQETGELLFLELNTMPMFAAFDRASGGDLVRSIVCYLAGTQ